MKMTHRKFVGLVIISALLVFGVGIPYESHVKRSRARERLRLHFGREASRLHSRLRRKMAIGSVSELERGRTIIAGDILTNGEIDDAAIIFSLISCTTGDGISAALRMEYVDENANVSQINYTPYDDPNALGRVFISAEEFGPPEMRNVGICRVEAHLRLDDNLPESAVPYFELGEERYYLKVPRGVLNNIIQKNGQLILLDKAGCVLDRIGLTDLE